MVTRHVSFCFPFVKKGRIRGFPSIFAGVFVEIDEAKCLLSSEKCVLLSPKKVQKTLCLHFVYIQRYDIYD